MAGDPFTGALAACAAGLGECEAPELLDELLELRIVTATGTAGQFAFRHPINRATVYESARTGWRSQAHARVVDLLAAQGARASALAPHVERSARPGDRQAEAVLVAAAESAMRRAPALAVRWYAAALRLLPETPETEARRVELLAALAQVLSGCGQLDASRIALCELLERVPARHPAHAMIVASCAGVEHLLGRHRAADTRLRTGLAVVAEPASIDAVRLQVELAVGSAFENRIST